ncbi:fluoride efflux transporter CrcB [Falsihalocynthiibacter sp. SS001]|uniref:fluoride efflux transporter CrcB n=1 Tax=Falsihalocynthiibacter sp. SS001 TaxID=3349698 RepID=UPI0036D2F2DC
MFLTLVYVALGGAIGSVMRFLAQAFVVRMFGVGFPWGTLSVNVLGSFLMGVLFVYFAGRESFVGAPFLMVGVLGGFTTFSSFSLDVFRLYDEGQLGAAALYVALSVVVSLAALVAGVWFAKGGFA